jgi:hypothetical protein
MTPTIKELIDGSREILVGGKSKTTTLHYFISQTNDDVTALALLKATAPLVFRGMTRISYKIKPVSEYTWDGVAEYEFNSPEGQEPKPPSEGTPPSQQFDSTGGTFKITQALKHIARYSYTGSDPAPDLKGAIGWNGEDVEGCDKIIPQWSQSETFYLPASFVTDAYKGTIFRLTGTVNLVTFRCFKPGEALFLGATGSQKRLGDNWEVNFKWLGSPNLDPVPGFTGNLASVKKKGWEYMWVYYKRQVSTDAKSIIKEPYWVYVEQIYSEEDWSALGIGS